MSDDRILVDASEMLATWQRQSGILKNVADGYEESVKEMQMTRKDNLKTREESRRMQRFVMLSCGATVLIAFLATGLISKLIFRVDDKVDALIRNQEGKVAEIRDSVAKTSIVVDELKKRSAALASLQSAAIDAELAEREKNSPGKTEALERARVAAAHASRLILVDAELGEKLNSSRHEAK